jgi:hypothetical protein
MTIYLEAIDGALRQRLVANPDINKMVSTRVYSAYLAAITNPQYPLICFSRLASQREFRYDKRVTCQYNIWIYSAKGFSETDAIFSAMKTSLDNEFFDLPNSLGRVGFRVTQYPSQDVDPDHTLNYATFTVVAIAYFK